MVCDVIPARATILEGTHTLARAIRHHKDLKPMNDDSQHTHTHIAERLYRRQVSLVSPTRERLPLDRYHPVVRYEVLAGAKLARKEKKRGRRKKKLAEIGSQTSFVMQTFTET